MLNFYIEFRGREVITHPAWRHIEHIESGQRELKTRNI